MSLYTFRNVHVANKQRSFYNVEINNIKTCYHAGTEDGKNKYYYINKGYTSQVIIYTERIPDFEAMFPVFPYNEQQYFKDSTIKRVDKLENDIVKLLSHVEAIMTVLQQRLPTDEPLTL